MNRVLRNVVLCLLVALIANPLMIGNPATAQETPSTATTAGGFNLNFSNAGEASEALRSVGSLWIAKDGTIQSDLGWDVSPANLFGGTYVYYDPYDQDSQREFTNFVFRAMVQVTGEAISIIYRGKKVDGRIIEQDEIVIEYPGYVGIWKEGKFLKALNGVASIKPGWNDIRVLVKKRKVKLYINDDLIWQGKGSRTRAGYVGVGASYLITFSGDKAIIDSVSLTPLDR